MKEGVQLNSNEMDENVEIEYRKGNLIKRKEDVFWIDDSVIIVAQMTMVTAFEKSEQTSKAYCTSLRMNVEVNVYFDFTPDCYRDGGDGKFPKKRKWRNW